MNLPYLSLSAPFPPSREAWPPESEAPGLLAAGADLTVPRLKEAYRQGIFPWYSQGQPVLWWAPDPRMVLQIEAFKLSRSLRKTIDKQWREGRLEIRFDHAFEEVIGACAAASRPGQAGTWITPVMMHAYCNLHQAGIAHSVETWIDGKLAGGLYLVNLGRMVFGESMFAHRTDASKMALAALVAFCRSESIPWIDCQQNTRHLASLGAAEVSRITFETHLQELTARPPPHRWTFTSALWSELRRQNHSISHASY